MNNNEFAAGPSSKTGGVAPGVARDHREDPSGLVSGVRRSTPPRAGGGFVTSPDDAMLTTLASVTAAGLAWIAQHTEDTLGGVHEAAPHHEAPTALNRTSVRDDSGALAL